MLPNKLEVTDEFITLLRKERAEHPIDGKILTAKELSSAIGKNIAWISQIEGKRLKKIKREDIISIYKVLYSETNDSKAEEIAEQNLKELISFAHFSKFVSKYSSDNDTTNNENATTEYDAENNTPFNTEYLAFLINNIGDVLIDKFASLKTSEETTRFIKLIQNLLDYLEHDFDVFSKIINKIPMDMYKFATNTEKEQFNNHLDDIHNLLSSFEIRYDEQRVIRQLNEPKKNLKWQRGNLLFGLISLSKIAQQPDKIKGSFIEYINSYVKLVQKYCLLTTGITPVIPLMTEKSTYEDWKTAIDDMQKALSERDDSYTHQMSILDILPDNISDMK